MFARPLVAAARRLAPAFLALALLLLPSNTLPVIAAGPWYVDSARGSNAGSCLSAGDACRTIAAAIARSADGDTILIAPGEYAENLTITRTIALAGATSSDTIVNGGGAGTVLSIAAEGVKVSRLTLRNGASAVSGGGVYLDGSATLSDVEIVGNRADRGGGLYVERGELTLLGGRVAGNTAGSGGGIYIAQAGASATLEGAVVEQNEATGPGGGLLLDQGAAILKHAQVINNTASAGAGAIISGFTASLAQIGGSIGGNTAEGSGGGLYVVRGLVNLLRVRVAGNAAANGGGALVADGVMNLTGGQVLSNTAAGDGGAAVLAPDTLSGTLTIQAACLAYNGDTAVVRGAAQSVSAQGNWWGAADGPSGAGSGGGDSVNSGVDYAGWLTTPPPGCPDVVADLAVTVTAGAESAVPGEAVTLAIAFANAGPGVARRGDIGVDLPAELVTLAAEAWTAGAESREPPGGTSGGGMAWAIPDLPVGARGGITVTAMVSPGLGSSLGLDRALAVTAHASSLTTDSAPGNDAAEADVAVALPRVAFETGGFTVGEGAGEAVIAVTVSPALHTAATVQVGLSDPAGVVVWPARALDLAAGAQGITFTVPVSVDAAGPDSRLLELWLRDPVGLALGEPPTATLALREGERPIELPPLLWPAP